ncbi:MAG: hypothetical protein ABIA66_02595 [Candidatus Omnitrophota bacterium]
MTLICDICEKPFEYHRRRKHCPDCAAELIRQYKEIWRLRHPDYNKLYLREWKAEFKELKLKFKIEKLARLAA